MKPLDLVATAEILLQSNRSKPSQASLCRAVSACYYALFHCLAYSCADTLVGGTATHQRDAVWQKTYRALEHGFAKNACKSVDLFSLAAGVQDFANAFVKLQELRHGADYDPNIRFRKSVVQALISETKIAISNFRRCSLQDRRAFAVHMLLKVRK